MPAVGRCLKRGTRLSLNKFPKKVGEVSVTPELIFCLAACNASAGQVTTVKGSEEDGCPRVATDRTWLPGGAFADGFAAVDEACPGRFGLE